MHAHKHTYIRRNAHTSQSFGSDTQQIFLYEDKDRKQSQSVENLPFSSEINTFDKEKYVIGIIALLFLKQYQFIKKHI